MSCIFTEKNGEIISVTTASGKPSKLFQDAFNLFNDRQQAIDTVAVTLTEDFNESVSYSGEEPSLKQTLDYIARNNANKNTLTSPQKQDLKNSLISIDVNSVEEFQDRLQQALYVDSIFAPTRKKLQDSAIYSQYEIENILQDIDLQEKIKSSVEALNNSEYDEAEYEDFLNLTDGVIEKTNDVNSFGKLNVINPYILKEEAVDLLAGRTEQQYEELLPEYPYQTVPDVSGYVRADNMQDNNGVIENSPVEDIAATINLGTKIVLNPALISDINTILSTPDAVLQNNPDSVKTVLKNIEAEAAKQGIDITELPADKNFLATLEAFLLNPTSANTSQFIADYSETFEKNTSPKQTPIKQADNRNYILLSTTKAEDLLLTEDGLLGIAPNTYIKVRRQSVDNLYSILLTYPEKLPTGVETRQQLEKYVEQVSAEIENIENTDNAEELVLTKMYFDAPLNTPQEVSKEEEMEKDDLFDGNTEYLQTDFIADFQIESLAQKRKNSDQWKYFYSNFEVNNGGINLRYTDPITINNVNTWIEEIKAGIANDLKQYSIISKQLPILGVVDTSDIITSIDNERAFAVNYPLTVEEITSQSYKVDNDNIVAKNNFQNFVRIGREVYESVESKDSLTLFTKLPQNNNNYNQYKISQPISKISLDDYSYLETSPETFVQKTNILNKEERENILTENFNCI